MTEAEFSALNRGDIIRHKGDGDSLVVTSRYSNHVIAVRTIRVSNPGEWSLIGKGPTHG